MSKEMYCPVCGGDSKTLNTKPLSTPFVIRRYKQCKDCGEKFNTDETPNVLSIVEILQKYLPKS